MNDLISRCNSEVSEAILAIQQPRTNFQLQHFVVGQHDTEPRRWWQCVLELQLKLQNLKRIEVERRKIIRRIKALQCGDDNARDDAALLELDIEEMDLAIVGAMREAETLFAIFKSFERSYTREDLDAAEEEYWQKRLTRQARHEINASGSIGVGNQESLEQIGISPGPLLTDATACLAQTRKSLTSSLS